MTFTFGSEILPFTVIYFFALALLFYGLYRKSVLISNLAAISLILIGLYAVQGGIPAVTGYTTEVVGNTTTITKIIHQQTNFAIDIFAIITMVLGATIMLLVNLSWAKEMMG